MALCVKPKVSSYTIPEVGEVHVKQLTGGELAEWMSVRRKIDTEDQSTYLTAGATLVALSLVREDGSRHYSTDDLDPIRELPADVLDAVVDACLTHNKLKPEVVEAEKKD